MISPNSVFSAVWYFKGRSFFKNTNGVLTEQNQDKVVDLRDITGTGYTQYNKAGFLLLGVFLFLIAFVSLFFLPLLSLLLAAGGLACIVYFVTHKDTLFSIEFAGGSICFLTSWYGKSVTDAFQAKLRRAMADVKDEKPAPTARVEVTAPPTPPAPSSTAAAIREFAQLRDEGVITEEDFQRKKNELLGGGPSQTPRRQFIPLKSL